MLVNMFVLSVYVHVCMLAFISVLCENKVIFYLQHIISQKCYLSPRRACFPNGSIDRGAILHSGRNRGHSFKNVKGLSYHSLYLLWHTKCPNSLCFTPGAYTVTDCSFVFSVLIVLFFPKIERLSWAFVCLQMLSPIGKGSIFGSLTVKVDTIFSCCACMKPARERCFFSCVFADEWCGV